MPTAEDFDAAAARLEQLAAGLAPVMVGVAGRMSDRVMVGGAATATTLRVIDDGTVTAGRQAAELEQLAAQCRHRAQVCRDAAAALAAHLAEVAAHDRAMSSWRADLRRHGLDPTHPSPGRPPSHPGRPPSHPSWVVLR